jgi:hypothetical protein
MRKRKEEKYIQKEIDRRLLARSNLSLRKKEEKRKRCMSYISISTQRRRDGVTFQLINPRWKNEEIT